MVNSSDPYHFIFSDAFVSSSQEELLKRIPGWHHANLNDSLTPSQPPLAASQEPDNLKLSVSANSDSEDVSALGDSCMCLYGVQGHLELDSPDTEHEKEEDSYDAAFESDRSQPPSSLRQGDGLFLAEFLSAPFITQSQVGTENVYESHPSTSKDMAQCLKADKFLQGANTRERAVDSLAKGSSPDTSFKIREFGRGSNSVVPDETKGPRDSEKTCSTRIHRKTTAVKKCPQSLQPEQPCHIVRSSEPSSVMVAAERFIEVCAEVKRDADTSTDESGLVRQCRQEREDLAFKDADVIKPDMAVKMPEEPVHVHQTSFDDFTKSKSTSTLCVSACEGGDNSRKRTTEERKFDSAVTIRKIKASKHVSRIQEQAETSSDAFNNQGLPEVVKKVASHETQQSQGCKQLGETANNDTFKNVSVEKCQLQQPTCSAGSPEDQDAGGSMIPSATELICTTRKKEKSDREKSCLGQSGDNKQSAHGKDIMTFPESVIDVVTLWSGCLPLCKPDDPDFLSLVIGSGVSLPLPFHRGRLH